MLDFSAGGEHRALEPTVKVEGAPDSSGLAVWSGLSPGASRCSRMANCKDSGIRFVA
jgi:hypothetical protein